MRISELTGNIAGIIVFILLMYLPIKSFYMRKLRKLKDIEERDSIVLALRKIKKIHPYIGLILIVIGLVHSRFAMGIFPPPIKHTGTILILLIALNGLIAIIGHKIKLFKRNWRYLHRAVAVLIILSLFVHRFFRNILYEIF